MIVYYDATAIQHISNPTDVQTAINALQNIINTLMQAAAQAALTGNMKEYSYDNGMTKTKVEYKDLKAITASMEALIRLKNMYLKYSNGTAVITLCDANNFPNWFPIF